MVSVVAEHHLDVHGGRDGRVTGPPRLSQYRDRNAGGINRKRHEAHVLHGQSQDGAEVMPALPSQGTGGGGDFGGDVSLRAGVAVQPIAGGGG